MGLYVPFNDIGVIYFPLADATQFLWKNSADQFLGTTPEVPALTHHRKRKGDGELFAISPFLYLLRRTPLNSVGCRSTSATHSNNSVGWSRSYCDGGGGSCCSAGWSSSCDGGGCDSGCFRRQRGVGLWRMGVAGRMQRPPSESRCAGWSRTN